MKSKLFKKTMALAMAGAMTLSLAACGDDAPESGAQQSGQQESEIGRAHV